MSCRVKTFPIHRLCAIACSLAFAAPLGAQEASDGEAEPQYVDSRAWQAHFEHSVERLLVREQLEQARTSLAPFDPDRVLRVLNELEEERLAWLSEYPKLPDDALPPMLARGARGVALDAARAYAKGDKARALELLRTSASIDDAHALHLRAQLIDQLTRGMHPIYRLAAIDLYREALRIDAELPQADRARVRIGQIYLELGFLAESRAALRPLLETLLTEPYATGALISLAEATFLDREPTHALELLARLDLEGLAPSLIEWELRRRADSLFALQRFTEALDLYLILLNGGQRIPMDALVGTRFGFALLLHQRARDAVDVLETVLALEPPPRLEAVTRLVLARALRQLRRYERATDIAAKIPGLWPHSQIAALGAVEALESSRLAGKENLALPLGTSEMVQPTTSIPAIGLLSYRVGIRPSPGDGPRAVIGRLGRLLVALPQGPVQLLAQDDLVSRLAGDLARYALREAPPESQVLDTAVRYLRPRIVGEDELLLALESLAIAGRRSTCVRWSSVLQRREPRPLRRGLAAWRRARCLSPADGDPGVATRLLVDADSGEAGPFGLALASLAAEHQLRAGKLERATQTYRRGAEALADPRLLGAVLLRLGELEAAAGSTKLARRSLTRGLTLTGEALSADPLRKIGVLALTRLDGPDGDVAQMISLLRQERKNSEAWWADAYGYLAVRAGAADTELDGQTPFARVAREVAQMQRLQTQIRNLKQRRQLAAE